MLVVVAIIAILAGLIIPAMSRVRAQSKSTACTSNLRTLGQGLAIYANEYDDNLVPGRMPKVDDLHWRIHIEGGLKYRPTFLAMMGSEVGLAPFEEPLPAKVAVTVGGRDYPAVDRDGQKGDRQNYSGEVYICPEEPNWTDERNGAYGYNYQFLGNSRLLDPNDPLSFKNWPVLYSSIRSPARTVAIGDSMGTAAAFSPRMRRPYENNARIVNSLGNEGFNLDPPWVDPIDGEVAYSMDEIIEEGGDPTVAFDLQDDVQGEPARSAIDPRHRDSANILWLDGHVSAETYETLGYTFGAEGEIDLAGSNCRWTGDGRDCVWTTRGCLTVEQLQP
jgi:prepilin-type processing-associated H-X9-DG protein